MPFFNSAKIVLLQYWILLFLFQHHYAQFPAGEEAKESKRCPKWLGTKQKDLLMECYGNNGTEEEHEEEKQCAEIVCSRPKNESNITFAMGCASDDFCSEDKSDKCVSLTHNAHSELLKCGIFEPKIWDKNSETTQKMLSAEETTTPTAPHKKTPIGTEKPKKTSNALTTTTTIVPSGGVGQMPSFCTVFLCWIAFAASLFALLNHF